MARKPARRNAASKQVAKATLPDGLMNAAPVPYPVADTSFTALQVYHNPDRRPSGDGPWNNEADKVSWIDNETGLGCIMLRQKNGTISGYVGVSPEHPLFGFEADAVPVSVSNTVHGGVTYGKACEVNRFERQAHGKPRRERYTVCHTTTSGLSRTIARCRPPRTSFMRIYGGWVSTPTIRATSFRAVDMVKVARVTPIAISRSSIRTASSWRAS